MEWILALQLGLDGPALQHSCKYVGILSTQFVFLVKAPE
jgi:hypothetical protein